MKFLLVLLVISCTHKPEVQKEPEILLKLSEKDIQECKDYQDKVLADALGKDQMTFTKNETQAKEFLAKFDVTKGLNEQKATLLSSILKSCDEDRIKTFDSSYKFLNRCSLMFSELEYFQSLAFALKNYRWSTQLKLEGKKVALDYVRYFADGNFPLVNRLVAMSVLDELSLNQVVNEKLHAEIKQHMTEARSYVESLHKKLEADPALNCESLSIIQEELNYSTQISHKIKDLLTRI